jgi:hypothetical protein
MSDYPELDRYLDEVSAQLGRFSGKHDVLLELRSDALDRAEDLGGGRVTPESVARAVEGMAHPAEVALLYRGSKYLIGPRVYRAFLFYTGIFFAVHIVLILVATATGTGIEIFPLSIVKLERPHTLLNLCSAAIQALLMDIGLMVVVFAGIGRARRTARLPSVAFRVPVGPRTSSTRAVLALLVLVLLNFFRDDFFIVAFEDRVEPLFTAAFARNLIWMNLLFGLVIARETAYAVLGERRWLVFADGLINLYGVGLMIWFLTQSPFIAVPHEVDAAKTAMLTLSDLMHKSMQLIFIAFAIGFAVVGVKRGIRFWQILR